MEKTDNWLAFGNEYLKAAEVASEKEEYAIVGVSSEAQDNKTTLILHVEREGVEKKFGCNKTNLFAVQQECQEGPKQAIGRIITFYKVDTQKPNGERVKGLRLKFKPQKEPKEVDSDNAGLDEDNLM